MRGLPAASYFEPGVAPLERGRIFERSWQFVCHSSDLPAAGTAIRFDVAGRSVAVLRGHHGGLHGFLNVCRHRGSRLIDGDPHTGLAFCLDARIRCPYHGWTYDESGALVHDPSSQHGTGLDRSAHALERVFVEEWRNLVFISITPPDTTLATALASFVPSQPEDEPAAWRRLGEPCTYAWQADWKLACEHLLDHSHHSIARPALKPRLLAAVSYEGCGPAALRLRGTIPGRDVAAAWPARAYLQWFPAGSVRTADLLFIWPNLLLQFLPEQLAVVQVLPAAAGSCTLREVAYGRPVVTRDVRLLRYTASRVRRRARAEDRRIVERVQQGLESAGAGDEGGPIADDETGLRWFAERWRTCTALPASTKSRRRAARPASPITAG